MATLTAYVGADGTLLRLAQEDEEHSEAEETTETEELTGEEAEHGEDEAHNPILPETSELFYAIVAFTILLIGMWKFAFPAVQKMMDNRTQRIRDNLDEAERTRAEASRILEDYQRQLADAKNESARIIEEARQTAEQMRRDLIARAEQEATDLRDRNRAEIEAARDRAMADIRGQVTELAIGAAEAVVQRNLDRDTQRGLVEAYINQVGSNS